MNNYITLDAYKYMTKLDWVRVPVKPATARSLLSGSIDVSYGPGVFHEYRGTIIGPVTSLGEGWGTISTLRTSLDKLEGLSFTDHESNSGTAHIFGEMPNQSLTPMWDSNSNEFYVPVRVVLE